MHEQRNALLTLLLLVLVGWGVFGWIVAPILPPEFQPVLLWHRIVPVVGAAGIVISLFLSIMSERTR